jgi:hypothetical protein
MSAEADSIPDMEQRNAACFSMWRRAKGQKDKPPKSSERVLSVFTVPQQLEIRREKIADREHLILPMTALVQGVYQCANCPTANYYDPNHFAKNAGAAWNGRPITLGHPQRDGSFVSAGSPDVWQTERIGTVFNARRDDDRLRCEAWLDVELVERAGAKAKNLLAAAEAGDEVEVSVAAFVDEFPKVGSHNGREYHSVQQNFQPDHIALLSDVKGACSWEDGCGVRVASVSDELAACCDDCAAGNPCSCEDEHDDDDEMEQQLQDFEDDNSEEDGEMTDPKTNGAAESQPSKTDQQQALPLNDQPAAAQQKTNPTDHLPADQKRIAELEARIEYLQAKVDAAPKVQTLDQYLAQAPEAIRESLFALHKDGERKRLELIDRIKTVPGNLYSEDELRGMQASQLEKLVSLVSSRADYSVRPAEYSRIAPATQGDDDFAPCPTSPWNDSPKAS